MLSPLTIHGMELNLHPGRPKRCFVSPLALRIGAMAGVLSGRLAVECRQALQGLGLALLAMLPKPAALERAAGAIR